MSNSKKAARRGPWLESAKTTPYTMWKYYPCNLCGKVFDQVPNLENHIRIHTKERPYKCDKCSYTAAQVSHIGVHASTRIAGSDVIPCSETGCDLVFCTIQSQQRHKAMDHPVRINRKRKRRIQAANLVTAIMARKRTRALTGNNAINEETQSKSGKTGILKVYPGNNINSKKRKHRRQDANLLTAIMARKRTRGMTKNSTIMKEVHTKSTETSENSPDIVDLVSDEESLAHKEAQQQKSRLSTRSTKGKINLENANPTNQVPIPSMSKQRKKVKPQIYKCNYCGFTNPSGKLIYKHLEVHGDVKPFCCHICDFRTSTFSSLAIHLRMHVAGVLTYCKIN